MKLAKNCAKKICRCCPEIVLRSEFAVVLEKVCSLWWSGMKQLQVPELVLGFLLGFASLLITFLLSSDFALHELGAREWIGRFLANTGKALSNPEKLAAALAAGIVAGKWLFEYTRKARLERFMKYEEMRERTDTGVLSTALEKLDESGTLGASSIVFTDEEVDSVMEFYEEIALMFNSKLIRPAVAYYMFGYFIIKSKTSPEFNKKYQALRGKYKDQDFWRVFEDFRDRMAQYHDRIQGDPNWGSRLLRKVRF
jgi:hypothetical protein